MAKSTLTQARLLDLLHYDPETGVFTWRLGGKGTRGPGSVAGCINGETGYWVITIDYRLYQAHILAWFYMTGEWPERQIDHKNTKRANNRWHNLRPATETQNNANRSLAKNNTSGFKGATLHKLSGRWRAQIGVAGKVRHLGYFDAPGEAHAAYLAAARELHGEYARAG